MQRTSWIASIIVTFGISSAIAQPDTRTPLERYEGASQFALLMCPLTFRAAQQIAEMSEKGIPPVETKSEYNGDYRRCIADRKPELKRAYDGALKVVKKPDARAALKEHYIATLTALSGIEPQLEENRMNYQRRQSENSGRVNERWTRFEAEN